MGSTQNGALQEKRGRDGKEETLQLVLNTPHRSIPLLLMLFPATKDKLSLMEALSNIEALGYIYRNQL